MYHVVSNNNPLYANMYVFDMGLLKYTKYDETFVYMVLLGI